MPRASNFNQLNPDQAIAICTREQAGQLVHYDHHLISVSGRIGLMLIQESAPLENHIGPFILTVVFHDTESHPSAPIEIQAIVDRLKFRVRGQPR